MGRRRALPAATASVLVGALLVALAAPAAGRRPGAVLDGCARTSATAELVGFGSGGRLRGIVFGHGRTGVVLANQSDEDLCGWLPFARAAAGQGLLMLAFD